MDINRISQTALNIVSESKSRITSRNLEKILGKIFPANKNMIKKAIRKLISDRQLTYTYNFGCSFLEKSFNKPVQISKRITIKPAGMFYKLKPEQVVIDIAHGAAFGAGDHPTTRLAIKGIEYSLSCFTFLKGARALDIGTGSGILAIVAVALGMKKAVGIDIDPCARSEALFNVKINKMDNKIQILDQNIYRMEGKFSLIMANLRYPTLKSLCTVFSKINKKNGVVVLSGLKVDEISDIIIFYNKNNYQCVWQQDEKDWAGLVLVRGPAEVK